VVGWQIDGRKPFNRSLNSRSFDYMVLLEE